MYQSQLPPKLKPKSQDPHTPMRWVMLITLLAGISLSVLAGIALAFILRSPVPLTTTALLTTIKPIIGYLFPSGSGNHKK